MQFDHRSGVTGCSDKNINAYHYNPAREVVRAHRSSKSFSNHPICELDLSEVKKITWMVFPPSLLTSKAGHCRASGSTTSPFDNARSFLTQCPNFHLLQKDCHPSIYRPRPKLLECSEEHTAKNKRDWGEGQGPTEFTTFAIDCMWSWTFVSSLLCFSY